MGLEKRLKVNKQVVRGCVKPWGVKCKPSYFAYKDAHIRNMFRLLVVKKMQVGERNKTEKLMQCFDSTNKVQQVQKKDVSTFFSFWFYKAFFFSQYTKTRKQGILKQLLKDLKR